MSNIDKQNTKVALSLEDFEYLTPYEKLCKDLLHDIRSAVYIDQMPSKDIIVVIRKNALQHIVVPYAAGDYKLDGYPDSDSIEVIWK